MGGSPLKKRSRLRYALEYAAVYLACVAVNRLPYRCTHAGAHVIAWTAFTVLRLRRRETVAGIMTAVGTDRRTAVRIAGRAYFNIVAAGLEFLRFRKLRRV
jgi:hypothetical protein